jgi:preprotein translocase subunit SecY
LLFPSTIGELFPGGALGGDAAQRVGAGRLALQCHLYVALIIFFSYFYTAVTFNPVDVADNMKKVGWLCAGDPSREEHGGLYRQGVEPRSRSAGVAVHERFVCVLPFFLIDIVGRELLLWRHGAC